MSVCLPKVVKLPTEWAVQDLASYIAVRLKLKDVPRGQVVKAARPLIDFFSDFFVIIGLVDQVQESGFQGTLWQTLSVGSLSYLSSGLNEPVEYWRHLYFSRFVKTSEEVEYYRYWLDQLEDAFWMISEVKDEVKQEALQHLEQAQQVILQRYQRDGYLVYYQGTAKKIRPRELSLTREELRGVRFDAGGA